VVGIGHGVSKYCCGENDHDRRCFIPANCILILWTYDVRSKVGSEVALELSKLFMNELHDPACKIGWSAVKDRCELVVLRF
jgi:hypothetical protein